MKEFVDKNQWALILGGSSGMGLASAKVLAKNGMNLFILHRDRRADMASIDEDFAVLRSHHVRVESWNVDAVSEIKMKAVIDAISSLEDNIKIKVLLHSIAKGNLKPIDHTAGSLKSNDFSVTIDSMAISLYSWSKEILDRDMFDEDARILAFTSEGSHKSWSNYAAVSAAKASIESIVRSLALELAPYNVKANCIQPGTTETRAFKLIPNAETLAEHAIQRNPYKRLTKPEDVANVVLLMSLPQSSWINGAIIPVDGGEHLR